MSELATTMGLQVDRDAETLKQDWLAQLEGLVKEIKGWVERSGWKTREITKAMRDSVLGEYRAPALLMARETIEVILNPVSRFVPGADGAVDLYLMPAYDDIANLHLVEGEWKVYFVFRDAPATDGLREPEALPLSEETIRRVLDEIAANAPAPL